jgi:hypothetical protein
MTKKGQVVKSKKEKDLDKYSTALRVDCERYKCSPCDLSRIVNSLGKWINMSYDLLDESELFAVTSSYVLLWAQARKQGSVMESGMDLRNDLCPECEYKYYAEQ